MLHKLMHNPVMTHLRKPVHAEYAKLLLRLVVGAVFIYHGYPKLFGGTAMTVEFFTRIGIPMAAFFAPFVGVVEFFGGLLLMLGLGTRLLGLALAFDMAVAIVSVKLYMSWGAGELELVLLVASLSLMFSGAGAYSLDAKMMKRGMGEHDASLPMAKA